MNKKNQVKIKIVYKRLSNIENSKPWILAWGIKTQMTFGLKDQNFMAALGESGSVRGWMYPRNINYSDPNQLYRFGFHNLKSYIELKYPIKQNLLVPSFSIPKFFHQSSALSNSSSVLFLILLVNVVIISKSLFFLLLNLYIQSKY